MYCTVDNNRAVITLRDADAVTCDGFDQLLEMQSIERDATIALEQLQRKLEKVMYCQYLSAESFRI